MSHLKPILLLMLLSSSLIASNSQNLQLDIPQRIQLAKSQQKTFNLKINSKSPPNSQLFIEANSINNDPFKLPKISLHYQNKQNQCVQNYQNHNTVCQLENSEKMQQQSQIDITLKCGFSCQFILEAYFSEIQRIKIGDKKFIEASQSSKEFLFEVTIPHSLVFTQIRISLQKINQAGELYINYGQNPLVPTIIQHSDDQLYRWPSFNAYILTKDQVKKGDKIIILASLKQNSQAYISVDSQAGNVRQIYVNIPYIDVIKNGEANVYQLSLEEFMIIQQTQIFFLMTILSGNPLLTISATEDFQDSQNIQTQKDTNMIALTVPELIKDLSQETHKIYIRVDTHDENCSIKIIPSLKQYQQNFKEIHLQQTTYIYTDPYNQNIPSYYLRTSTQSNKEHNRLKINLKNYNQNQIILKAYRCILQTYTMQKCLPQNTIDLQDQDKFQIVYSSDNTKQFIPLNSDICHPVVVVNNSDTSTQNICDLIFIATPKNTNSKSHAVFTVIQDKNSKILEESQTSYNKLYKTQSQFFYFLLDQKDQVDQIFFYLNVLAGNPTMDITMGDKQLAEQTTQSFILAKSEDQISSGVYQIQVQANQYSEFTLSVILHHSFEQQNEQFNSKVKPIQLQGGITMKYELPQNISQTMFGYKSDGQKNIKIQVIDLLGHTITKIKVKDEQKTCISGVCQININRNQEVNIIVQGSKNQKIVFTITVQQDAQCYIFPIGVPLYTVLQSQQADCIQYNVNKNEPFQISTSIKPFEQMNRNIDINVIVSQKQENIHIMGGSVTLDQQSFLDCNEQICPVIINIKNVANTKQNNTSSFSLTGQYLNKNLQIYDGVSHRIQNINLTRQKGKHFTYFPSGIDDIQIYLTTQSSTKYLIFIKILDLQNNQYIQNQFPKQDDDSDWKFISMTEHPRLIKETISNQKIKQYVKERGIKSPIMLISVHADTLTQKVCTFNLQITQKQRVLRLGSILTGYLIKDQIITYQVYTNGQQSILQTMSLIQNQQGQNCLKAVQPSQLKQNRMQIASNKKQPIYIQLINTQTQICSFQITLQPKIRNVTQLVQGFNHQIEITRGRLDFLYYHNRNVSFKILEFIEAGESEMLVTQIQPQDIDNIFQQIAKIKQQDYFFKRQNTHYLQIDSHEGNKGFCYKCYYLITFNASLYFKSEVSIISQDAAVSLRDHLIANDMLQILQTDTFIYYADFKNDFYISLDIISGTVQFVISRVIDTEHEHYLNHTIKTGNKVVQVAHSELEVDSLVIYKIKIMARTQTVYNIQINKQNYYAHLVSGIPKTIDLKPSQSFTFGFYGDKFFKNISIHFSYQKQFKHEVQAEFKPWGQKLYHKISEISQKSDLVQVLKMKKQQGYFRVKIINKGKQNTHVGVILPRSSLTQLMPQHSFVLSEITTFQIYIPPEHRAIVQVYDCLGNIVVKVNKNYNLVRQFKLSPVNQQYLHENIAGHYAFQVQGQFQRVVSYIQITSIYMQPLKQKQVFFRINYFLLPKNIASPYDHLTNKGFHIDYEIGKSLSKGEFNFSTIRSDNPEKIVLDQISYKLINSKQQIGIKSGYMCLSHEDLIYQLGSKTSKDDNQLLNNTNNATIYVKNKLLQTAIKQKRLYSNIIAHINCSYVDQDRKINLPMLTYFYNDLKFNQQWGFQTDVIDPKGDRFMEKYSFIKWILIILLILIAITIVYVVIVKLKNKAVKHQNQINQLVEEKDEKDGTTVNVNLSEQVSDQIQAPSVNVMKQ